MRPCDLVLKLDKLRFGRLSQTGNSTKKKVAEGYKAFSFSISAFKKVNKTANCNHRIKQPDVAEYGTGRRFKVYEKLTFVDHERKLFFKKKKRKPSFSEC